MIKLKWYTYIKLDKYCKNELFLNKTEFLN